MSRVASPLKWHGGKAHLASKIVALMPPHTHYVEPFAGGLSVLLAKDPAGVSEVVNDLDGRVANFWAAIRDPETFARFARLVAAVPFVEAEWDKADGPHTDPVAAAVAFFVRCRQSLAGRMAGFAPLSRNRTRGGMNEQASAWLSAVEGLPAVHERLKRVVILNRPALDVIRRQDGPGTLFYLDPPYLHSTRATTGEYAHEMTEEQHTDLCTAIRKCAGKVLLSGYPSELYRSQLEAEGWHRTDFEVANSAAGGKAKRRMTECVWTNFDPRRIAVPKPATKTKPAQVRTPAPPGRVPGSIDPKDLAVRANYAGLDFDPAGNPDDAALVESVRTHGVLQNLVVRAVADKTKEPVAWDGGDRKGVTLEVVAGHRRRAAAVAAGLDRVPIECHHLTDDEVTAIQLVENIQRRTVKPSREAAAFAELAAKGWSLERIASTTGKPVSFVRAALALAKLPSWALAAVDAGALPRATAELVARVPGEESRKRCAVRVLENCSPGMIDDAWCDARIKEFDKKGIPDAADIEPLSYRETKELIRSHFQRQLKGAPFSLKVVYTYPGCEPGHERSMPTCDACPKRAGNDEEARAEGVRQDVCLDPECYGEKVEAYRESERAKFRKRFKLDADAEVNPDGAALAGEKPARGWVEWTGTFGGSELSGDVPPKLHALKVSDTIFDLPAGVPVAGCRPQLAFDPKDRPRVLVKAKDVLKALQAAGVLPKPEKRKPETKPARSETTGPDRETKAPAGGPKPATPKGPSEYEVKGRAALVAALKCRDMVLANAESVSEMGRAGGPDTDAVYQALSFVARVVVRDWADVGDDRYDVLNRYFKLPGETGYNSEAGKAITSALIDDMTPAQLVGFLLAAAAHVAIADPRKGEEKFREDLIAYADTSWDECVTEARRELAGGEAEEAEENPDPPAFQTPTYLSEIDDIPDAVLDLLMGPDASGKLTLERVLADCDAATSAVSPLPLRNRLVTYFVKLGAKIKPAELAAKAIADHVEGKESAARDVVHCAKCKATFDAAGRTTCPSCSKPLDVSKAKGGAK